MLTSRIPENSRTYQAIDISDKVVYDHARCGLTMQEICDLFKISRPTFIKLYGPSFSAGKAAMKSKPRLSLYRLINRMEEELEQQAYLNDYSLVDQYLKALKQANDYLPKELKIEERASEVDMSDEELLQRIADLVTP